MLSTAAALDQFTILLMASPAFWMLRPKKKKKTNLRVTALCISCPFITSLRKFSRCYFQNTSKIQLLPTLPVAALNPAPSSSARLLPALNHCQPLPAVYSEWQPRDTPLMSLLCSKPASHLIHGKSQSPHGGLLICSSFEHHFSIFSLTLFQLHLPPGYSLNMPGKLPLPPLVWTVPVVRMVCPYYLYSYLFYSIQASNQIAPSS